MFSFDIIVHDIFAATLVFSVNIEHNKVPGTPLFLVDDIVQIKFSDISIR